MRNRMQGRREPLSHSEPLLTLEDASVRRGEQTLLQGISLNLFPQEIVTVIGPNGAGKSTLVKLASGLIKPSSGTVKRHAQLRIGYMPQKLTFDTSLPLTVQRFLTLSSSKGADVDAVKRRLRVESLSSKSVHVLSGGELQRVLLARALLRTPQLLVLDEPVQGVDVAGQAELYQLITELRDELGCSVLMVSHDLHIVMAQTDRVVCLNNHICCQGQPESVSTDPAYLQLFGKEAADTMAVYTHQHDHSHDLQGNVIAGDACNHGGTHPHSDQPERH